MSNTQFTSAMAVESAERVDGRFDAIDRGFDQMRDWIEHRARVRRRTRMGTRTSIVRPFTFCVNLREVDRLRQAIGSAVQHKPVPFLVDEIFGGTNSRDRRTARERWCAHW